MYCKNNKHEVNTKTYKFNHVRDYKPRSSLDEDLCDECLNVVLNWKNERPTEIKDEDFDKRELNVDADMVDKIKSFI